MNIDPSKLSEFKVVSALDDQMVLDCAINQNNVVVLWKWHNGQNQKWNIIDLGNGKFTFLNVQNSQVITSPMDIHSEGWLIKCSVSKKTQNQIWEMIPCLQQKFKQKYAFYIKSSKSGKVLDVYEQKAKNGQSIIQWEMKKQHKIKSKLNQIWLFEPVSFIPQKKSFYKIFSSFDYDLVFDISKSQVKKNCLILNACHKEDSQKFHIETYKGKYIFKSKDNDHLLAVQGKQKGAKVSLKTQKKQDQQFWQLIPCKKNQFEGKSAYYIKSVHGFYLDTLNEKAFKQAQIVQSQFSGNQSQVWIIVKV